MMIFFIALSIGYWMADLWIRVSVSDIQPKHVECQMKERESFRSEIFKNQSISLVVRCRPWPGRPRLDSIYPQSDEEGERYGVILSEDKRLQM